MTITELYHSVNVCILIYTEMYLQIEISVLQSLPNINVSIKMKEESITTNVLRVFVRMPLYKIRNIKVDSHPEAI